MACYHPSLPSLHVELPCSPSPLSPPRGRLQPHAVFRDKVGAHSLFVLFAPASTSGRGVVSPWSLVNETARCSRVLPWPAGTAVARDRWRFGHGDLLAAFAIHSIRRGRGGRGVWFGRVSRFNGGQTARDNACSVDLLLFLRHHMQACSSAPCLSQHEPWANRRAWTDARALDAPRLGHWLRVGLPLPLKWRNMERRLPALGQPAPEPGFQRPGPVERGEGSTRQEGPVSLGSRC